jgi:[ribosomal protein S5]-alanine N-acetyltransferase
MRKWFPIQTDRLFLREFTATDETDVHEYAGDPIASRYVDWGPNTPEVTHQRLVERLAEQRAWPRDHVSLAVELPIEAKVIGTFRLSVIDRALALGDFGFVFNASYWNRGYGTEATRAVLENAFSILKLHRVIATCDTRNVGSWRLMEKAGMRREGHFVKDVFQKGEWRNSYLYAKLADES